MALQGTLRDFGIADIFQLIGQQQKTGTLELRRPGGGLDVHFYRGMIVGAEPTGSDPDQRLLDALVRTGIVEPEDRMRVTEQAREALARLRDFIVDAGIAPNEDVAAIEQLSATEEIFALFHWSDGQFLFVQREIEVDADSFPPISAEHVLMEGFRMVDEWPAIERVVPDAGARVQQLATPQPVRKKEKKKAPDDFFDLGDELDDDDDEDGGLSREEQRVLEIAEPGQTVQWLIDRSRLGRFEATKAVADLVTKGYLKLDTLTPQMETGSLFFETGAPGRTAMIVLAVIGTLSALLLVIRYGAVASAVSTPWQAKAAVESVQTRQGLYKVRLALETHFLLDGTYPESLAVLGEKGLLGAELVVSGKQSPYVYQRVEGEGGRPAYRLELAPGAN